MWFAASLRLSATWRFLDMPVATTCVQVVQTEPGGKREKDGLAGLTSGIHKQGCLDAQS